MEFGKMNWVSKMEVGEMVRCKIKDIKHNNKGIPYIRATDSNGQFFMINISFEQADELEGVEDVVMTCTGYNDEGFRVLSFDVASEENTLSDYLDLDVEEELSEPISDEVGTSFEALPGHHCSKCICDVQEHIYDVLREVQELESESINVADSGAFNACLYEIEESLVEVYCTVEKLELYARLTKK